MRSIPHFLICLFLFNLWGCKEPFEPDLDSPAAGYLVVEGFINTAAQQTTRIQLSRASTLKRRILVPELRAIVQIVGENSNTITLEEKANGIYESDPLKLSAQRYQLKIKTASGKEYLSDLEEDKKTPAIDSISWTRVNEGLMINVHAHDDNNKTKYYKWSFDETWEVRSSVRSSFKFRETNTIDTRTNLPFIVPEPISDAESDKSYYCWATGRSASISLGSTINLQKDIIKAPIFLIPNKNKRLFHLYSIEVQQIALNQEGYNFFDNLKQNTETNGSIFDKQPSELKGNIRCVTTPDELVIGYIGVSSLEKKRIFIERPADWETDLRCLGLEKTPIPDSQDSIRKYWLGYGAVGVNRGPSGIISIILNPKECIECTLQGASNVKPAFWPF